MLKAGLDGIKKNLVPPKPVEEDIYKFSDAKLDALNIDRLPYSLWQAVKAMKSSELVKETL